MAWGNSVARRGSMHPGQLRGCGCNGRAWVELLLLSIPFARELKFTSLHGTKALFPSRTMQIGGGKPVLGPRVKVEEKKASSSSTIIIIRIRSQLLFGRLPRSKPHRAKLTFVLVLLIEASPIGLTYLCASIALRSKPYRANFSLCLLSSSKRAP